jgi:type I restriction enzyme S subunit
MSDIAALETGASYPAVRDSDVLDQPIPVPPLAEQRDIAAALKAVRTSLLHESECERVAIDLKRSATRKLFTHGLRGEAQKDTEIGPVPESWELGRLDLYAKIISTRMTYSELESFRPTSEDNAVRVVGIKVADMNLAGNEVELRRASMRTTRCHHFPEARGRDCD